MTRDQIDDVAKAGRLAAIGQAVKHGNRCVFAIVVVGLDVGAPLAVQTNVTDATPEQVIRILQNGIAGLRNSKGKIGGGGGGLITLSVLAVVFGILAAVVAGCGNVEASNATADGGTGSAGVSGAGAAAGAGGAIPNGMAGGGAAGAAGTDGATGGAATGGTAGAGAGAAGAAGVTGGTGGAAGGAAGADAGLTGAAGAGGATCAGRVTGAICYQCPAPAPTCGAANHGAYLCCDKTGNPACDPGWCRS